MTENNPEINPINDNTDENRPTVESGLESTSAEIHPETEEVAASEEPAAVVEEATPVVEEAEAAHHEPAAAVEEATPVVEEAEAIHHEHAAIQEEPAQVEAEEPASVEAEEPAQVEAEEPASVEAEEPAQVEAEVEEPKAVQPKVEAPVSAPVVEPKPAKKSAPVISPLQDDFDWEAYSGKSHHYPTEERRKMEDMYSGTLSTLNANEVVHATVVAVTDRDVVLNVGFKSDGLVALSEFRDLGEIKPGMTVDVLVVSQEDQNGQLQLSRKAARMMTAWTSIVKAHEEELVIEGKVKARTKGGLVVDVNGIETFLPGSQIDVKPVRDYDQYVGKTMEFKVVKINPILRNAVVSHKILIESDIEAQKVEIMSQMVQGQVLEGTVKNMTDFGVFVDLGGVDGLLHITDISWGRVSHPSEALALDQKIQVVVLEFDNERKRISLGMKQLTPHPWQSLSDDVIAGSIVEGKVATVADYGAFLELAPGVEGLIHVSEMSWSQHLRNPSDFMKTGETVKAVVLSIDREERKMSLGIKQLTPDPWQDITTRFPIGSKHMGKVRNLTNFGLFVEIGEGVDGLVHINDLSWTKKINHPAEFTKRDEVMEVVVLDIDTASRRLSLGHKQLTDNPWDTLEYVFAVGTVHRGHITQIDDKVAIVALSYGVDGVVFKKGLATEQGKPLSVDMDADFKVTEFNRETRRIVLSHSDTWKDIKEAGKASEDNEVAQYQAKAAVAAQEDKGSLSGSGVLAGLRDQILEDEKRSLSKAEKKPASKKKVEPTADDSESNEG
jgi:small subunit ribosomal protein S1